MAFNQTNIVLYEEYLMFFINTMYQLILSWMAVGLGSLIGIFELGKFKKKSVKSFLFIVLYMMFIISLVKVYDHWTWILIYKRELHEYTKNFLLNNGTKLIFPPPGNIITQRFDWFVNLPFKYDWVAGISLIVILMVGAKLWFENCCDYSYNEFREHIQGLFKSH